MTLKGWVTLMPSKKVQEKCLGWQIMNGNTFIDFNMDTIWDDDYFDKLGDA